METLPVEHSDTRVSMGHDDDAPLAIPTELKQLYMDTYFKGLDENQALIAYRDAKRRRLSIEAKQIHFIPRWDNKLKKSIPTAQTSIDGFRLIASRTGKYGGSLNAKLTVRLESGEKAVIPHEEYDPDEVRQIISGTISVINRDFDQPQTATALFKGYAQAFDDGNLMGLWAKMPDVMILKCAESLALRKAFPQDLSGIYTNEEMAQADNESPKFNRPRKTYATTVTPNPEVAESEAIEVQVTATVIDRSQESVEAEQTQEVQEIAQEVKEPEKPTEKKAPAKKKEKTIPELIKGIPAALKHRKADYDHEVLPFCEQFVLNHFNAKTPEDIPEDQRGAVLEFLKNDLINHLVEHGEL